MNTILDKSPATEWENLVNYPINTVTVAAPFKFEPKSYEVGNSKEIATNPTPALHQSKTEFGSIQKSKNFAIIVKPLFIF